MSLKVRRTDPNNIKYNNIKGSGLFPVEPICLSEACKPKPNPVFKGPVPAGKIRNQLPPLIATKQGDQNNKWELNGQVYPTFNSLWVNIPKRQYTQLRVKKLNNGRNC